MASLTKTTNIKRTNRDAKKTANRAKKAKKSLAKNKANPKIIKL